MHGRTSPVLHDGRGVFEGLQFHPESILTPDGPELLAAFLAQ